jgi:hypothetical protein
VATAIEIERGIRPGGWPVIPVEFCRSSLLISSATRKTSLSLNSFFSFARPVSEGRGRLAENLEVGCSAARALGETDSPSIRVAVGSGGHHVKTCILDAQPGPQLWKRRLAHCRWLLLALLSVACGGRTAIESDLPPSTPESGGVGGAAYSLSWDQVVWDGIYEEAVAYLWTGSVSDTWAVVSDSVGSFQREHWDGTRFTRTVPANDPSAPFDGSQIWAVADDDAFGGSSKNLQRWIGKSWFDWLGSPGCHAVAGRTLDDLWCATDTDLWRFDGAQWTRQAMSGIRGILARARDDVWVWGELGASHFDGVRWGLEFVGLVKRVSASGPNDVWVVQDGNLFHSTGPGTPWTRQNPTGGQIASVWSESPTNTWIVAAGAAMRWDGSSWLLMPLPMQDERLLISGSSEDIWIAGTQLLIHGHPIRK